MVSFSDLAVASLQSLLLLLFLGPERVRTKTKDQRHHDSADQMPPGFHIDPHGTTTTSSGFSSMRCSGFFPAIASLYLNGIVIWLAVLVPQGVDALDSHKGGKSA